MKKKLMLLIFGLIISGSLFAENGEKNLQLEIIDLIDDDLKGNSLKIKKNSKKLSPVEKYFVYEKTKKSSVNLPMIINFFTGYGVGSFLQKDFKRGTIGLGMDALAISLVLYGVKNENNVQSEMGMIIYMSSRAFQVLAPHLYVKEYNELLRKNLNVFGNIRVESNIKFLKTRLSSQKILPSFVLDVKF